MRFLIVEDEWLIANGIEQSLISAGHGVLATVGSVAKAQAAIRAGGFDAVVLDANLGGDSSLPIADLLATDGIPFVVVSGYGPDQRPGRLGTAPFLRKPFNSHDLLKLIHAGVLDGSRQNMS